MATKINAPVWLIDRSHRDEAMGRTVQRRRRPSTCDDPEREEKKPREESIPAEQRDRNFFNRTKKRGLH
jgi:hypothetical protein